MIIGKSLPLTLEVENCSSDNIKTIEFGITQRIIYRKGCPKSCQDPYEKINYKKLWRKKVPFKVSQTLTKPKQQQNPLSFRFRCIPVTPQPSKFQRLMFLWKPLILLPSMFCILRLQKFLPKIEKPSKKLRYPSRWCTLRPSERPDFHLLRMPWSMTPHKFMPLYRLHFCSPTLRHLTMKPSMCPDNHRIENHTSVYCKNIYFLLINLYRLRCFWILCSGYGLSKFWCLFFRLL